MPRLIRIAACRSASLSAATRRPGRIGFLLDTILTRDVWMHRLDIGLALGEAPHLTRDHDGALVGDVVHEWALRHAQPCHVHLTGPAGGTWTFGDGGTHLELDAMEFCRTVARRESGAGLLAVEVPFWGSRGRHLAAGAVAQDGGMTSPTNPGAANRRVSAWRAAPPADSARAAFNLTSVWALTAVLWGAPYVFDGNRATTLPVLVLMGGVLGLLALLTALFVGLQALAGRRQRVVRSVIYVDDLVAPSRSRCCWWARASSRSAVIPTVGSTGSASGQWPSRLSRSCSGRRARGRPELPAARRSHS